MSCAACLRLLGQVVIDAAPPDASFPLNISSGVSRSFVGKQFAQPKICAFCGALFFEPKVKPDVRVYRPERKP